MCVFCVCTSVFVYVYVCVCVCVCLLLHFIVYFESFYREKKLQKNCVFLGFSLSLCVSVCMCLVYVSVCVCVCVCVGREGAVGVIWVEGTSRPSHIIVITTIFSC